VVLLDAFSTRLPTFATIWSRLGVLSTTFYLATAARALASSDPAVPAIENIGYDAFVEELVEAISGIYDSQVGARIISEFGWATARKPRH
jgi:hypothetical protein